MGIWLEIKIFKVFICSFQLLIKIGIKIAQPPQTQQVRNAYDFISYMAFKDFNCFISIFKHCWQIFGTVWIGSINHFLTPVFDHLRSWYHHQKHIYQPTVKLDAQVCLWLEIYWQTQSRQSKSKSKADDLVFIKIAMSNHPPTPLHRESFKEAR